MKYFLFLLLLISFNFCNEVSNQDISNIEFLLETDLNVGYKIKNIETPFDFANSYISFDLIFEENEFELLRKNIDLNKFDKVDYNDLGLNNKLQYYRNYISENKEIHLTVDTITYTLHYSSKK